MQKTYTSMIQVQTLKSEGLSNSVIARKVGLHRETVAKYLKILEVGRRTGTPLHDLIPKKGGHRPRIIDPFLDYIYNRLEKYPELTANRLYKEIRKQGYDGSKRTVRRYVNQIKGGLPQRVYKPYETDMGEQAQVDWGHEWVEWNGQKTKIYVFAFILSHSRQRYVEYVLSLDGVTFLHSLQRAFTYMQGVPKIVLFDNAKTVVSERVGSTIRFQADLLQYAAIMGFTPKACWVHDPETKGKVESTVGYVRRDFFYGQSFTSLDDLNRKAREWCDEVNREIHSTTQQIPYEVWQQEKETLRPLPTEETSIFRTLTVKVGKTSLFSFGGNQYSVPKEYARKTIRLEVYEREFKAFAESVEIGHWPRTQERGQRFIEERHCEGRFKGNKQSLLENEFCQLCEKATPYLEGLVEHRGTSLREQMEKIIQLAKESSKEDFQQAMGRAVEFGNYGYDSLKRILKKQREAPDSLPQISGSNSSVSTCLSPILIDVEVRDLQYYADKGGNPWTPSQTA